MPRCAVNSPVVSGAERVCLLSALCSGRKNNQIQVIHIVGAFTQLLIHGRRGTQAGVSGAAGRLRSSPTPGA